MNEGLPRPQANATYTHHTHTLTHSTPAHYTSMLYHTRHSIQNIERSIFWRRFKNNNEHDEWSIADFVFLLLYITIISCWISNVCGYLKILDIQYG